MLHDREAKSFLFGSYARGEATARSDVDLMVILKSPPPHEWYIEVARLRRRLEWNKAVDLLVCDEETYESWRKVKGSMSYNVAREGVRLV